jgi:hypothetical protein
MVQTLRGNRIQHVGLTVLEVGNHQVILLKRAQHWAQLRMRSCDGREQGAVFALVRLSRTVQKPWQYSSNSRVTAA